MKGIGKELAARLVRKFGLTTLDVIERTPQLLREVEGIGPQRSAQIVEAWQGQREIRDLMVFLQSYGVSAALAARIHARYGQKARRMIEENPYRLAEDISGVGFLTADRIALKLDGFARSPHRLEAGALYALREKAEEGHTLVSRKSLTEECARLLDLDTGACADAIDGLEARGAAVAQRLDGEELVGLAQLSDAEAGAAALLAALCSFAAPPLGAQVDQLLSAFGSASGIALSSQQRQAVLGACTQKVLIVTGGPGTGKTTLLKAILSVLDRSGLRVALCAPTGRAAKRMQEATDHEAKTIHRLLEYGRTGFARDRDNPLGCDALIVDEASMVDVVLFHALLRATPAHCRLVMVGDKDQLPSVGPGNVLADLIHSGVLPVVQLSEVFRQAQRSSIVVNAHRINTGVSLTLEANEAADFFFIERNEPPEIIDTVHELLLHRIPARFGLDPRHDVQVLSPMQRGPLGVVALNADVQALLNPSGAPASPGGLRLGDRVLQLRNDYDRGVYNGDIGWVEAADEADRSLSVRFDERLVRYEWEDLSALALAYVSTIHKSQGSEFPAVVVILHTQHYVLLARNLLYTAVTRARKLAVIVGSRKALAIAIKNASAGSRTTGLANHLRRELAPLAGRTGSS